MVKIGSTRKYKKSRVNTRKNRKGYKHKICVGKIFADWCGHCVALKPEWDKMKKMIKQNKSKNIHLSFCEIGDTEQNQIKGLTVDKQLIKLNKKYFPNGEQTVEIFGGFPTIFKICDNKLEYYSGPRIAEEMYKWFT